MTAPVLSVEGLTLALPAMADRAHAVEAVTLAIRPGETLCVVGESGSGKSMIAHAVMGLLPKAVKPAAGAIRLAGRDLLGDAHDRVERGHRLLEDHADLPAAHILHGHLVQSEEIAPGELDRTGDWLHRLGQQAHHGMGDHRLA